MLPLFYVLLVSLNKNKAPAINTIVDDSGTCTTLSIFTTFEEVLARKTKTALFDNKAIYYSDIIEIKVNSPNTT